MSSSSSTVGCWREIGSVVSASARKVGVW
jgi:hypothetical protein